MGKIKSEGRIKTRQLLSREPPNELYPDQGDFLRLLSEVEDYAIFLLNKDGIIVSWNKGAQKIKGYTDNEIIGKSHRVFYPKEDNEAGLPASLLKEACDKGRAVHEGWRVRKDGTRFWGSITITALHGDEGEVTGYLKVTKDLTEKKIVEDKSSNYVEELRLKNEALRKSEERYHRMIAEVQDYAIILLDIEGSVLEWNRGAEKLTGYTASEIMGKSFRLFYPNEDKLNNLPQHLLQEATTKGFVTHEGYRLRKDGTRFWGNVAITALHDETGQLIGFSKVTRDLTKQKIADDKLSVFMEELKQKNEALKKSEERYHRMVEEVQDYAILLLDTTGKIQNWNRGAQAIKGYSAQEIIGKSFKLFYTPEDIERGLPDKLLTEAAMTGKAMSEGWRLRKDRSKFWGSIVITALHDDSGHLIGFSKVTRDLTERKKSEDSLRNSKLELELKNLELEKLNADLSSFAYIVSHDLKEPVRKIQIFAGRQLEQNLPAPDFKELARKIGSSASRMQKLMAALIAYSQLSGPATHEVVDLNGVLEAVLNDLEIVINESAANIRTDRLPLVNGNSAQLHQLFLNLLSNSMKFSRQDATPQINITCRFISHAELPEPLIVKNKEYNLVTVSDNGIGFDQSQSSRIFEVFHRLKPASEVSGTGIGLAIVKRVVENHDGLVLAEGQENSGASFKIYLPAVTSPKY